MVPPRSPVRQGTSDARQVTQDVGGEQEAEAAERGDARDGEDEVRGTDDLGATASGAHVPDVAGSDGTGGHGTLILLTTG